MKTLHDRQRKNKRQRQDEVEIYITSETSKQKVQELSQAQASNLQEDANINHYWTSTEAKKLFCPNLTTDLEDGTNAIKDGTIQQVLINRQLILHKASCNDESLLLILDYESSLDTLSDKVKERLRMQCIYLSKAYENALQYMSAVSN